MSDDFDISVSPEVDSATAAAIEHGLDTFNANWTGSDPSRSLWIVARDSLGTVVGGIRSVIQWNWIVIEWVWVCETMRHQGLGGRLLAKAEEAASMNGCCNAMLYTFSFQAPEFYRRLGYREFGRLDDFPPGHSRIWLCKALSPNSTASTASLPLNRKN